MPDMQPPVERRHPVVSISGVLCVLVYRQHDSLVVVNDTSRPTIVCASSLIYVVIDGGVLKCFTIRSFFRANAPESLKIRARTSHALQPLLHCSD